MKLLAIECAGQACSVALSINGESHQRLQQANAQQHSKLLLPMQQAVLAEAGMSLNQLDAIVCGYGPGSFTGVRVAVAVTQGLAFGAHLPTLGLCSLAAMAWGALQEHKAQQVLVALDARMDEVYWGHYQRDGERLATQQPHDLAGPTQLPSLALNDCIGIGSGWLPYEAELANYREQCTAIVHDYPQQAVDVAGYASEVLNAGAESLVAAEQLQPLYLRNKVTG